jgi:hypothetical protein
MRCLILLSLVACDRTGPSRSDTGAGLRAADDTGLVDRDEDGWAWPEDCDDTDPSIHPGATEICDDQDNDCDGTTDGESAVDRQPAFVDGDGDGHGDPDQPIWVCRIAWGQSGIGDDCDDFNSDNYPGNSESCDDLDNDCDTAVDEGLAQSDWFLDQDGDGYGSGDPKTACEAPPGHVADGGDCDDSTASASPAQLEVCGDNLDNDCDGTDNGCTPAGEVSLADAWTTVLGGSDGLQLGYGIASAGDLDGDGTIDLWVGATGAQIDGQPTGGVVLISGPLGGTLDASATGTAWFFGSAADDGLGRAMAQGDIDGDGLPDALAGAWGDDTAGNNAGVVTGHLGPVQPSKDPAVRLAGPLSDSYFGWSIAVDDVDGDGIADVLVGGPTDSAAASKSGGAWLFYGPLSGSVEAADADARFYGQAQDDQAGAYVALVDLDGDGLKDPVLGAPFSDRDQSNGGTVYGITGIPKGDIGLAAANVAWTGEDAGDNARLPASAGDLDGDGLEDLIVGAPYSDRGGKDSGAVYVLYGPATAGGSLGAADAVLAGSAPGDQAGLAAAGIGDFNGDGLGDLLVGAFSADSETGHAALFLGPVFGDLSLTTAQVFWTGIQAGDQAGWSVAPAGDLNADGTADVLVGARLAEGQAGAVYGLIGGGI